MHAPLQSHLPAVMLATVMVLAGTAGAVEPGRPTPSAQAPASPGTRLLTTVTDFRQQAQSQPDAAFARFVGNKAKAQQLFGPLGRTLCPTSDPAKGWSGFFETSLWNVRCISFTTAVAIFYHPYSDVALVTAWTRNDAGITLSDAELLMGDALRNRGKPPYENNPLWLRGSIPAYLAAGVASAQTLRISEQILFSLNKPAKAGWRAAFPSLANPTAMEANRLGVGAMFERNLAGLNQYLTDQSMQSLRDQSQQALQRIRAAQFDMVYQMASATQPYIRPALEKHPDQWGQARVIACVTTRDKQTTAGTFVLLGIPGKPEFLMSFWFQEPTPKTQPPVLKRIDLLDQNATYKYLDFIEKMIREI